MLNFLKKRLASIKRRAQQKRALPLVVNRTAEIRSSDVLLVCCLRNEAQRMDYFCQYYRNLGVNHFLLIDNDSTDGILDWARQQKDVSLWHTKESYKASRFGMEWCNYLLQTYGTGHLCVTVDPDEFLVYPHMETRGLADLGQHLKDVRRDSMCVVMLDAYSDKPLAETVLHPGQSPFDVCPYFDKDGYIQNEGHMLNTFIQGGPRMRIHNRHSPQIAPALNKIPVVWWKRHFQYESSMHNMTPLRLNRAHTPGRVSITGCLFHFKFVSSLQDKVAEEMKRKEHYEGGREYVRYGTVSEPVFYAPDISERYESPKQLIKLGLMAPGEWF